MQAEELQEERGRRVEEDVTKWIAEISTREKKKGKPGGERGEKRYVNVVWKRRGYGSSPGHGCEHGGCGWEKIQAVVYP